MSENHEELIAKWMEEQTKTERMRMQVVSRVCALLRKHKITAVSMNYNGSGDEGENQPIDAFDQIVNLENARNVDVNYELTELLYKMAVPEEWLVNAREEGGYFSSVGSVGEGIGDLLAEFVPSGYEDNEGGTGYLLLNAETELIEGEHGAYITEVHWHKRRIYESGKVEIIKEKEETDS